MDALVVASNRPKHVVEFVKAWQTQLRQVKLIVMHDSTNNMETATLREDLSMIRGQFELYNQLDIAADIPENAWIIPEKTGACKSYGILKAWQSKVDVVFNLDDDCMP